jgi:DNA-directed RNA polymerase subunit RPC12/RpoP
MAETDELVLDIEKQSIRGRACPRCGGKIIPSNRAVYQSAGVSATDVYPLWQCERCGYAQLSAKVEDAPKHGKATPAGKESPASTAPAAPSATAAFMQDAKGRPLPRDVQMVLERMPKQQPKTP